MDIRTYYGIIENNMQLYASKQLTLEQFKEIHDIIYPKVVDTWEGFRVEKDQKEIKRYLYRQMIHLKNIGILSLEDMKQIKKHYV